MGFNKPLNVLTRPEASGPTRSSALAVLIGASICGLLTACTPTVQVAPPDKPITINMNIKIEHEIRVKLDKQLEDQVFSEDSGLF